MQGRRLYRLEDGLFEKRDGHLVPTTWRLWDYWQETDGIWYACSPVGLANLANHNVEKHLDGTITVSPSILVTGETQWHGYLVRGEWREA